ncbi:MAG: BCAM0308 family protein [Rhodocyclaceae bacterium]|nr:BCAM0308 family protein [Rhodocyclaceae bacterium]
MTNISQSVSAGFHPVRRDQLRPERVHDTYKLQHKLAEPTACPECGAVYHAGRWQWGARSAGAREVVCPACQRIRDNFPAGFVEVGGNYFAAHRDEILSLLHHHESREKADHPLARIMAVADTADGVLVTTTDIHLARDLGEALHHAQQGDLEFHYNEAENLLRVHWRRQL